VCFKRIKLSVYLTLVLLIIPYIVLADNDAVSTVLAARAINDFAFDLYKELATEGGNIFFSPYSISAALTMTFAGAREETANEMASTLRFAGNEAEIHASVKSIQDRFDAISDDLGILDIANRLWLNSGNELLPDFKRIVERYYGAGFSSVDFSREPDNARLTINNWVAQETRDKIKDILSPGSITTLTRLVLTNAIYFNANWEHQFDIRDTRHLPFFSRLNESKLTPMMTRTDSYFYGENDEMQWIKMPYKIPNISMVVLLPRENETFTQLEEIEKSLSSESLTRMLSRMRSERVRLQFPRFKDEQNYSLPSVLSKLGMQQSFRPDADFSGLMDIANGLYISDVVHQAFIEVDEKGTEAAATDGVVSVTGAERVREFNANRPFIYFIYDELTGVILFMGRKIEV